jgi:hypothetical protein
VTSLAYCRQDTCFRHTTGSLTTDATHGQPRTQRCCPDNSPH